MAVLRRVCEETPQPLRESNPDVPDWLQAVVARLHAKNPDYRFQTAAEVVEALGRRQAPTDLVPPVRRRPGHKWIKQAAVIVILLVAVALAAAGVAVFRARPPAEEARATDGGGGTAREEPPPWRPRPPRTAEELAKLPSPLDALKRDGMDVPDYSPPEVLASLGEPPYFRVTPQVSRGWMAQSPDGRLLAVNDFGRVLLFETATGVLVRSLGGSANYARRCDFSPDGKSLAGACGPHLFVWDVATGAYEASASPQDSWSVAFGRDSKLVVSGDAGGTSHVGLRSARYAIFAGHTKGVTQIAFSPDGKKLAAITEGFVPQLCPWDVDGGGQAARAAGLTKAPVFDVAFHPGGRLAATVSSWGRLELWDVTAPDREPRSLALQGGYAYGLAFSPEGRYAAVGLENGTIAMVKVTRR